MIDTTEIEKERQKVFLVRQAEIGGIGWILRLICTYACTVVSTVIGMSSSLLWLQSAAKMDQPIQL